MKAIAMIRQTERNAAFALERFMTSISEEDWGEILAIIKSSRIPIVANAFEDSLKEAKIAANNCKIARTTFNPEDVLLAKVRSHE